MYTFAWMKILLAITGLVLIVFGGYLYFLQWSGVLDIRTRAYNYISEAERDKRSLKAGLSVMILVFGVCFIASAFLGPSTIFLPLGVCASPLIVLAATFRMRKDLGPYTKMRDEVVFLNKKNSKNH